MQLNCFVIGSEFIAVMSCTFGLSLSSHLCFQLCSLESTNTNFSQPISLPRANLKSQSYYTAVILLPTILWQMESSIQILLMGVICFALLWTIYVEYAQSGKYNGDMHWYKTTSWFIDLCIAFILCICLYYQLCAYSGSAETDMKCTWLWDIWAG